ncbi:MAG: 6-oxocyclohex-1-ene-1-carbonyl-CoA hydratase [Planctomycetes bacterium]|nr:6-oxocyclohex-1-ene-1-carbonyl-CoA hydratase [Planctomycetota bacterium]
MNDLVSHELPCTATSGQVRYETRPVRDGSGATVDGLHAVWLTLDNPRQLNSYTTDMVKDVILGLRRASCDRRAVAVVFTGAGDQAFCTGGNTKEYAEYYAGRPEEYRQYMRLFNDMVSAVLACDKPVICRANGMRIGGGQELGMACDYTIAQDLARFGQAGPRHGSAPDGGATDFLPLFVGIEHATLSCTACEPWSAHKAHRLGLLTEVVSCVVVDGRVVPNPLVITDRWVDPTTGQLVWGEPKQGEAREEGKALLARGAVDLSRLDEAVDRLLTKLLETFPGCLTRTLESLRKHKLQHWDRNRESSRAWLALNMLSEAHAGFRAFNEGPKGRREVDFALLRRRIAEGRPFDQALIDEVQPAPASVP